MYKNVIYVRFMLAKMDYLWLVWHTSFDIVFHDDQKRRGVFSAFIETS